MLIVPNIALSITEQAPAIVKITDILLPLGIYYILMSLSAKVGRTVLYFLPITFLAAFQIVQLHLYGESIISIDMFLNIATSNISEATELLSNLGVAIGLVLLFYIPVVIWAAILTRKRQTYPLSCQSSLRRVGLITGIAGLLMLAACMLSDIRFSIRRDIFPVNVISNLVEACTRTIATINYKTSSADYKFSPVTTHDNDSTEIYVLIIGETSRADNWELFGYERKTNPLLTQRNDIVKFPYTLSESNTTYKSVPMMLSNLTAKNFGDSIYMVKGMPEAFNEAGFRTAFISNQQRNHSLIDFFGSEAHSTSFVKDNHHDAKDLDILPLLRTFIADNIGQKMFIILHTYGSHFNYKERYDDRFAVFRPDNASEATPENRAALVNAYDNSILYTDHFINEVIESVDSIGVPAAIVYTSDHGEDLYDDERGRLLHASPTPTFTQLHVPMLLWTSRAYNSLYPEKERWARINSDKQVSSSRSVFNTVMSLSGVNTPKMDIHADLCSPDYTQPVRLFLNDYNQGVTLDDAGLRKQDFKKAKSENITTK